MDFGFNIPTRGPLANPHAMATLATRGESLGFAWLAIADHIVIPRTIDSRYPYSDSGQMAGAADGDCYEQLTLMTWLAAITRRPRLLTSVMVVPHRPPVLTAKTLATIDVLSGGRVTVGCGAGWMDEEFRAIGAPPFAERGKVTDEYLAIFKTLWTDDDPEYAGSYARFSDVTFLPKPVQKPHPPLWIGGESPAAVRRAARFGDAWYPIGSNPQFPLDTADRYAAAVARLRVEAEAYGRDPASLGLAYWANWYRGDGQELRTDHGERRLFTGGDQAIAEDADRLAELGVQHLLVNFQRAELAQSLDAMEHFAERVLPMVRHR